MMNVYVEDRDTPGGVAQPCCGHRRVVQIAETARKARAGVVPAGPTQRLGRSGAAPDKLNGVSHGVGAGAGRAPSLRGNGTGHIGQVIACLGR